MARRKRDADGPESEWDRLRRRILELGGTPIDTNSDREPVFCFCGRQFIAMQADFGDERVLFHNHHCDETRIASIEQRRANHAELGRQQPRNYTQRLAECADLFRTH